MDTGNRTPNRQGPKPYALGIGITFTALLTRFLLDPYLADYLPYVTFFIGIAVVTYYGNLGASLLALALGGIAANYFFMSPRRAFVLVGMANYVGLATYFLTALTIVAFGHAFREARRRAETLTERFRQEVLDRANAEAALRESESRFRSIADTTPVLIWMSDSTNRYTWFNKAWFEFTGRAIGADSSKGWSELVHEQDVERYATVYQDLSGSQLPFAREYRVRRHDGEYRWLMEQGIPRFTEDGLFLGYIGSCVDISDRRRDEARLIENELRFRTLADNMCQFAWMADSKGWLFWYNQRWYDYTGTTFDTMGGWGWKKVHHPDHLDRVLQSWRRAHATGEPWEDTFPLRGKDGTYRWFLSRAVPIRDQNGNVIHWFGTNTDITELREAHAALTKSEARYRTLYESIDEAFCVIQVVFDERNQAVDYVFLEVNPSFPTQTGIENAQGRSMREIAPQHEPHWFDLYGTIVLTGESKRFEYPAVELNRWYEGYAYRIGDAQERKVGILFNDITERRVAQEHLRQSEQRLRLALEAGQMGAWEVDLQTGAVTWDAKQCELFGLPNAYAPKSMNEFYTLVHPEDVSALKAAAAKAGYSGLFAHEFRIAQLDGKVMWIAGSGATMKDESGQPVRMVGINYDVTARRQTEAHLRSFAEELERKVRERTQELMHSQERLRSLAAELNLAEQRERKRLAGELHDYLAQWLVLCRINLGQVRRENVPLPNDGKIEQTETLLDEALTYCRTLIAELSPRVLHDHGFAASLKWLGESMHRHGLLVRTAIDNSTDVTMPEESAVLLFQSVRELLMNALKHARAKEVMLRHFKHNENIYVEVRDDGIGFDIGAEGPECQSKFGLFSIRERMVALGGSFELDSQPGQGTTATLILPVGQVPQIAAQQQEQPREVPLRERLPIAHSHPPTDKVRVLLVDDHPMVRQGLRSLLITYPSLEVVGEASDGQEATEMTDRLRPMLVIMDVNMPRMNGIEATAIIKARSPHTHIIGLSVNAVQDTERAMKDAGAALLLPKESAAKELYDAIRAVMGEGILWSAPDDDVDL